MRWLASADRWKRFAVSAPLFAWSAAVAYAYPTRPGTIVAVVLLLAAVFVVLFDGKWRFVSVRDNSLEAAPLAADGYRPAYRASKGRTKDATVLVVGGVLLALQTLGIAPLDLNTLETATEIAAKGTEVWSHLEGLALCVYAALGIGLRKRDNG